LCIIIMLFMQIVNQIIFSNLRHSHFPDNSRPADSADPALGRGTISKEESDQQVWESLEIHHGGCHRCQRQVDPARPTLGGVTCRSAS